MAFFDLGSSKDSPLTGLLDRRQEPRLSPEHETAILYKWCTPNQRVTARVLDQSRRGMGVMLESHGFDKLDQVGVECGDKDYSAIINNITEIADGLFRLGLKWVPNR